MAAVGTVEFWKYWEGRVVDKAFPLLRCLGGGATSAVFLTEVAGEKGRRAALRLVRANSPGAELQLSRWQRASKLSHPHLIRLLSMGRCQLDDTTMLYLVMEYADENLSEVLPSRPLSETETSQMLPPVLDTLRYIHRQGFVHGHLKPSNVMAIDDQVKISSDGLCSMSGRGEHRSAPGPYDPPEVATKGASPAGDVWSLGVTLSEVLTQHLGQGVPEGISARLADVIGHCLQSDPANRWTVDQIAKSLGLPVPKVASPAVSRPAGQAIAPAKRSLAWRYIVPLAALAGLGALAMREFHPAPASHSEAAPAAVVQPQPEAVQPEKIPPKPAQPENVQAKKAPPQDVQPEQKKAPPEKAPVETKPMASGEILDQVLPTVLPHAQASVRGKFLVDVRVHVDPDGSVRDANLTLHGPSKYFAGLTLQAARKWRFRPTDAAQDWVLHFKFEKSGITVVPAHVSP